MFNDQVSNVFTLNHSMFKYNTSIYNTENSDIISCSNKIDF